MTATIVLIHGGKSTVAKLQAAMPDANVALAYREGLSASYDERTGIAHDFPTLEEFMAEYAPDWSLGEPLAVLAFSAGGWALRYYLRDPRARELISAAIFLDSTYCGDPCDPTVNFGGVIAFAEAANADPSQKRLVMTYSQAHPGPGRGANAIEAAAGAGPGVFVRGYANADHGGQQGIVGPEMVRELIAGWIEGVTAPGAGGGGGSGWLWWLLAAAGVWYIASRRR